jgi:hypothetical protein
LKVISVFLCVGFLLFGQSSIYAQRYRKQMMEMNKMVAGALAHKKPSRHWGFSFGIWAPEAGPFARLG